ncbi:sulfurtransferase TusA family protein [Methylobacterium sp. BTF04]|uniref:sulfurtransferase TusA family protein n=1 Tax=Methylobacterium sp. BTF04 TaxID=2708300 RepID=UPI0013CFE6F4|nr:sulfurtransferase TusA family protein [Methylobacterium sp. BTF04]NEU13410.1 sulfurtransferase TusA family protein [Methylobacterium sp. BTF04]
MATCHARDFFVNGPASRGTSLLDAAEKPVELDLTGLKCPLPVLRTRKALRRLDPGELLVVVCTDPLAAIDIPHLVREEGDALVAQDRAGTAMRFTIRRSRLR